MKQRREVSLDEGTPLGFTGKQLVERSSLSAAVALQIAERSPTTLHIETLHQGAPLFYTPRVKVLDMPGLDAAKYCVQKLSTAVTMSLRSDDGTIMLSQPATLSAPALDRLSVDQRLKILGDTSAFADAQELTGRLDLPAMYVQGMDAAVADIQVRLPGGAGTIVVAGETVAGNTRRRLPSRVVASWTGQ